MKFSQTVPFAFALLTGAAVGFAPHPLHAGGAEHYCDSGQEKVELWDLSSSSDLEWQVVRQYQTHVYAPNFPHISCTGGSVDRTFPVFQSLTAAMDTWEDAEIPGSSGVSMTSLDVPDWTFNASGPQGPGPLGTGPSTNVASDGQNLVTFFERPSFFGPNGGSLAIAVTVVTRNDTTGFITDADIAFNAASWDDDENSDTWLYNYWDFYEDNDLHGETFTTQQDDDERPILGYVDIQGAAVHEFGHFLGLAHSLVDAATNGSASATPSMFPFAQVTMSADFTAHDYSGSCQVSTYLATPGDTDLGGLVGVPARTLTPDDLSALAEIYPSSAVATSLGKITGEILDSTGSAARPGAHVVAIRADGPDTDRIGTLSYTDGEFELIGLRPGSYYVYVETVETGTGGYFSPGTFVVPEYVDPTFGCVSSPTFVPEFWDNSETTESNPERATPITVTAGSSTAIEVRVRTGTPNLRICSPASSVSSCTYSSRGIQVQLEGAVRLGRVRVEDPAHASYPMLVVLATSRVSALLGDSELLQVPLTGSGHVATEYVALDSSGNYQANFNIGPAWVNTNFFFQGVVVDPNTQDVYLTNAVNAMVTTP